MTKRQFQVLIVLICASTGAFLSWNPVVGLIVVASILFAGLLERGPTFVLGVAIAAACGSRVLQSVGVPRLINYLHFVLVAEAFVAVQMRRASMLASAMNLARGLAATAGICFFSWALNGGEFLRPVLMWLVLFEPFLVIFILVQSRPTLRASERLRSLLVSIMLIQIPFVLVQSVRSHGDGDSSQGTFVGAGAGAHVVGGVALIGVLYCVARALTSGGRVRRIAIVAAAALFVIPVISDAKQAIACFVPGLMLVLWRSHRGSFVKLLPPVALALVILGSAYIVYKPLQRLSDGMMLQEGIGGKIAAFQDLAGELAKRPTGWLLGVGPGNSLSRIAILTGEAPLQAAGLRVSPVTVALLDVTKHNYLWRSSSAFSAVSSWAGILGDIGPLGLIAYLWLASLVWRELAQLGTWQSVGALGAFVMAALLGFVYSWLEEPGFMLIIASTAGLAITAARHERSFAGNMSNASIAGTVLRGGLQVPAIST